MLEPNVRALFLDSLRPPPGFTLDRAIGTTFTVDLTSALTVPLALAGYNLSGAADPIAVMQALRSTADRVDVFAQAGMISSGTWPGDLTALLEPMLHTVPRPRPGHLFHPKTWVLRFIDAEGDTLYRCIVSSRNLTPDRSWDTLLRLDSEPEAHRVNPNNHGLVALLDALPSMAEPELTSSRADEIHELAAELRRVSWQHPDGVDWIRFLAFGVKGGASKRERLNTFRGYRHLLIAPFLTDDGIQELLGDTTETKLTIVSRAEAIDQLDMTAIENAHFFTLNPLAEFRDNENATKESLLGGLHAKVYVIEASNHAYVYVGSANATKAAFGGNVEICCELGGGRKALGVGPLLDSGSPFRSLLEDYTPPEESPSPPDDTTERALEGMLIDLAGATFTVDAQPDEGGWAAHLRSGTLAPTPTKIPDATISIAPFNSPADAKPIKPGVRVDLQFSARAAADLTSFFVVSATSAFNGRRITRAAVIKATWINEPAGRLDDVMIRQLDTPEKFLRFVMLLLALGNEAPTGIDATLGGGSAWQRSNSPSGLFELLVRALASNPQAVDRLEDIVEHLRNSPIAANVLPDGWDEVWAAISSARLLIGREVMA